jgi:hypothetical protein
MSYGKLVVKLTVFDSELSEEEGTYLKASRQVSLLTRHCVTHSQAQKLARAFVEANVSKDQQPELSVFWYPEPVRIGTWHC